ncbi:lathosterol oxidase-like [Lineus longissimus]|uniref:lathosterol oxidase-like n=1 Tax=Lineus longissimus TaxID=88925 RepID=UPI002B4D6CE8
MDIVLNLVDHHFFTPYVYPPTWPEDDPYRQLITLFIIVNMGGYFLYLATAALSYFFLYDRTLMRHPLYIPNQVSKEITYACCSIPLMSVPTNLLFFLEVRGYGKLYDNIEESKWGWSGVIFSCITFILFTDALIYWIHRFLHHKTIYKYIHKDHHRWKVPTPFASHAFHPVDGFLQSCPYHIYAFLFPLHKFTYLILFVFVNMWTVSIHDGNYHVPEPLKPVVNGSAHHMDHHLFYNYNYGQFFTLWDRIGGSFRHPSSFEGQGPAEEVLRKEAEKAKLQNGHSASNGTRASNGNSLSNGKKFE